MLLIKTRIGVSKIHGFGLFADQFISKNTVTWRYSPGIDPAFSEADLAKLSPMTKEQVLYYAYFDKKIDRYILPIDDQRFINHSANSALINIDSTPDYDTARRDIQPGEELLCDYNLFDNDYFSRRGLKPEHLN